MDQWGEGVDRCAAIGVCNHPMMAGFRTKRVPGPDPGAEIGRVLKILAEIFDKEGAARRMVVIGNGHGAKQIFDALFHCRVSEAFPE